MDMMTIFFEDVYFINGLIKPVGGASDTPLLRIYCVVVLIKAVER
jgi:hypothetical protein